MPQNKVDVSGINSACGAYSFLHLFDDNFNRIDWGQPQFREFLNTFAKYYGGAATSQGFREALDEIGTYLGKEMVLGAAMKKHIALMLKADNEYRHNEALYFQFLTAVREFLEGVQPEGTNTSFILSNMTYLTAIKNTFERSNFNIDQFMTFVGEKKNDTDIPILQKYFREHGFNFYIDALGDLRNNYMFTGEELYHYARIMNIDIEIYNEYTSMQNDAVVKNDVLIIKHESTNQPVMSVQLVNVHDGAHWNYYAPYLQVDEVNQRNAEINAFNVEENAKAKAAKEAAEATAKAAAEAAEAAKKEVDNTTTVTAASQPNIVMQYNNAVAATTNAPTANGVATSKASDIEQVVKKQKI